VERSFTIDPPPPLAAAGSSLLYSTEFYALARTRLTEGGVLQQWVPGGADPVALASAIRALTSVFADVRAFRSVAGWGWHFLASDRPLGTLSPEELAVRLPEAASADLVEWGPGRTAVQQFRMLGPGMPVDSLIAEAPHAPALTDDRPLNEYFLLRTLAAAR